MSRTDGRRRSKAQRRGEASLEEAVRIEADRAERSELVSV